MVSPWSVLDVHGADATRWYMLTAGPPGNTHRFSANLVKEVVGKFLLTLWNSYSFFVTYANLNDFDPSAPPVPLAQCSVLDRWVLAKLNALVETVTQAMESYDVTGATRPISDFVEELSNWYVRLSRRRFWNVEPDPESQRLSLAAHQTMVQVLVTVSQLLAPFTPFIADEIYRNLAGPGVNPSAPVSVHLSRWPAPVPAHADEELVRDMALAQRVVGLGRAARESASLRLRQPLAEAIVGLPTQREAVALERLADEVIEELNVKALRTVTAGSDLVEVAIHPLPKQLGSKYGSRFPAIRQALLAMDPLRVATVVEAGQPVGVSVEGEILQVLPEELEVRKSPKPGLAVAEEAGYLVAVTTELTEELRLEGYAREISRNIQELRKKSGFEISDRIRTTVAATPELAPLWERHGEAIAADTLSVSFTQGEPEADAFSAPVKLDSHEVVVAIKKA
jgi:isoleucyl-tRNA synthetase